MKKLKVWLVIALVFGAGFAAGVVVTRAVVRHFVKQVALNPNRLRDTIEKRMTARLQLDAAQQQKVHQILTDTEADLKALRQDFTPRFLGIMSNAETEVSAALTPEQREEFAKFLAENRQFWRPR